jgi:hypothetical protein
MGRRHIGAIVVAAATLVAAGCGGGSESESESKAACEQASAAMTGTPQLPSGFPSPTEVTYTGESKDGPTTKVSGYWKGDLDEAYDAYQSALDGTNGYSVTKKEKEKDDAEVNFSGNGTTGQVKLQEECAGRTTVTVTVRPA